MLQICGYDPAMNPTQPMDTKPPGSWQALLLVLSIYVLGALLYETIFVVSPGTHELLRTIDTLICILFLTDFFIRLNRAPNKLQFMRWGWIDLLSSIPQVDFLRWGRAFRVFRIIRAFRSTRHLIAFTWSHRGQNTFALVSTITILLIIFAAIAVLNLETGEDSNIQSPLDALWWSIVTVTTVGYGDRFPVTPEGRIVAMILMVAGVGLFGTFTGFVASLFAEPKQDQEAAGLSELTAEVRHLHERLERIETLLKTRHESDTPSPPSP